MKNLAKTGFDEFAELSSIHEQLRFGNVAKPSATSDRLW